jgi:hypothetical protein
MFTDGKKKRQYVAGEFTGERMTGNGETQETDFALLLNMKKGKVKGREITEVLFKDEERGVVFGESFPVSKKDFEEAIKEAERA